MKNLTNDVTISRFVFFSPRRRWKTPLIYLVTLSHDVMWPLLQPPQPRIQSRPFSFASRIAERVAPNFFTFTSKSSTSSLFVLFCLYVCFSSIWTTVTINVLMIAMVWSGIYCAGSVGRVNLMMSSQCAVEGNMSTGMARTGRKGLPESLLVGGRTRLGGWGKGWESDRDRGEIRKHRKQQKEKKRKKKRKTDSTKLPEADFGSHET